MIWFENIFAKKFGEKIGVCFAQTTNSFCQNLMKTLVPKNKNNYSPKSGKNCKNYNIEPRFSSKFSNLTKNRVCMQFWIVDKKKYLKNRNY
jgi:hypothetical protein